MIGVARNALLALLACVACLGPLAAQAPAVIDAAPVTAAPTDSRSSTAFSPRPGKKTWPASNRAAPRTPRAMFLSSARSSPGIRLVRR